MAPRVITLLLLVSFTIAPPVSAQLLSDAGSAIIEDAASVDEAVAGITEVLEEQGFEIVAVIDHAAAAAGIGPGLPPTKVVMFRNRIADAFAIRRGQTIGIDLPLKILVWETEPEAGDGEIRLLSNSASFLAERHNIRIRDGLLALFERVQGQFEDPGLVTVRSSRSVADTAQALQDALAGAGFRIPLVIDYKADAGFFRRGLRETTLVVAGNPNVGTLLMQNSREVALNLPQKFLIWEDRHGEVNISYNDPAFIAARGGVQGLDTLLGNIDRALANFANAAAGGE